MLALPPSIPFFFNQVLNISWQVFRNWWWLIAPFVLWKPFVFLWKNWRVYWWLRTVYNPVLLEIKIPKENLKPVRAMEDVMASFHGAVYHPPDWWETHIDGQVQTSIVFEIASIGGEIHFFVRCHEGYRDAVEASIYAQYPDAEISIAEDYTKKVPQDIPNDNWNMWATDYKVLKDDVYPILTYKKFETEQESAEEQKVDPIASLLEALAKVKPGEQFWVQMACTPMARDPDNPHDPVKAWLDRSEAERDKLAKREVETKTATKPMVLEAADILITGRVPEEKAKEEKPFLPPEMKLTPGEREIVYAVEQKNSKPLFSVNIRFVFLGKRDVFNKGNLRLGFTFFASYSTLDLNALVPYGPTISKVKKGRFLPWNKLIPRRLYLKNRRMFRNYVSRLTPLFPRTPPAKTKFVLNTEELASLFHFPSWRAAPTPTVTRAEAKRAAPPGLPTE